jgi:hypothetical protein
MSTFPVRAIAALALCAMPVEAMAQEIDGV